MIRRSTGHQDMAMDVNELNEPVARAVYGSCRLSLAAIKKGDLLAFLSQNRVLQLILVAGYLSFPLRRMAPDRKV